MAKEVYILVGPPGSGKTTWTKSQFEKLSPYFNIGVCSSDHFFTDNLTNEYKFDGRKLNAAHKACQTKFQELISNEYDIIIVDNTNLKKADRKFYVDLATDNGYTIIYVKFDGRYENIHGVSDEKMKSMIATYNSSECEFLKDDYVLVIK